VDETTWIADGNNVMGAAADGWWRDRPGAVRRLAQDVAGWARSHSDPVTLVFDGVADERVVALGGGNLAVVFSGSTARDSADDVIVDLARAVSGGERDSRVVVASSDRGLRARLPASVEVLGGGAFLRMVRPVPPGDERGSRRTR
jgi:hypothetical protein